MSIIRQRRKNLIISGLLGFLLGAVMLVLLGYVYRQPIGNYLAVTPSKHVELPVLVPAIVASKPIAKGTVMTEEHVMAIMVPEENSVTEHFGDALQLVGKTAAIDIDENMPLTNPMFAEGDLISNGQRLYEVSFIELPYHLSSEDLVDIRIAFPTGQEYVVLSKKQVKGFERQTDSIHSGLLSLALEEEEALRLSSALVDCFIAEGTRVYMVKYVDGEHQAAAVVNYPVNEHVRQLIKENPNILEIPDLVEAIEARESLKTALSAIIDENNKIAYRVNMTVPGMTYDRSEGESTEEESTSDSQTSVISEPVQSTSGKGNTKPTVNTAGDIGF